MSHRRFIQMTSSDFVSEMPAIFTDVLKYARFVNTSVLFSCFCPFLS